VIRGKLLRWYDDNARDLPWRRTRDPYAIWIAEVMLQQTRVETVLPYYARFLERWPDVGALARASIDEVLSAWSGLGYYRRARLLHRGAQFVAEQRSFPRDVDGIREIPGVGAYTTGAIASQAYDLPAPLVDGNVARVLSRLFAIDTDVKKGPGLARVWALAADLVAGERPGAFNNALMELGATVCVPREPRCLVCPVRDDCEARKLGRERELPIASEKPIRPRIREVALVLRVRGRDGNVMVRRRAEGLFGGMWEPPRIAARDRHAARSAVEDALGITITLDDQRARKVEHVLTHRHLEVSVVSGVASRVPTEVRGDDWDAVALVADLSGRGVSTLARKLLG
jgi:A/G-specific adenine glycosylase